MLARHPDGGTRIVAATAAAYAVVLATDLVVPAGNPYRHDARTVAGLAVAAVFIVSTGLFASWPDAGWMPATMRRAGTAAVLGVAAGMGLAALATAAGLELPSDGMRIRIDECWACEAPWDAAARLVATMIGGGLAAAILAVPAGAVSRELGFRAGITS